MSVIKVITSFSKLRDAELATRAQTIVDNMTGNSNYPTPTPALTEVTAALATYRDALSQAESRTKEKIVIKNEKRKALESLLNALAMYVQTNCQNDLATLLSSGFHSRKPGSPIGTLIKPENLKVVNGPNLGSMKLSIDKIAGAVSYMFEYSEVPVSEESRWIARGSTARTYTVEGLSSGKEYAFRVAGVGADPTLVYSDVVSRFAQ